MNTKNLIIAGVGLGIAYGLYRYWKSIPASPSAAEESPIVVPPSQIMTRAESDARAMQDRGYAQRRDLCLRKMSWLKAYGTMYPTAEQKARKRLVPLKYSPACFNV